MLADFKNSFAVGLGLSSKFATRLVPYFPPQLKRHFAKYKINDQQ